MVWQCLSKAFAIKRIAEQTIITVAGTNGKGSACHMLSLMLAPQGKTGVYTSPHIHRFNERIRINQQAVCDKTIIAALQAIEKHRGDISLSYFEVSTLAALLIFAQQKVDFAILEVGLGGRLDAVNIIDADAAIITAIGRDHEQYLGDDPGQIAVEKAGVYRRHQLSIYAEKTLFPELSKYTKTHGIELLINGRDYHLSEQSISVDDKIFSLPTSITALGAHQISNFAGVLVLLHRLDRLPYDYLNLLAAFNLCGRFQKIHQQPDIIIDVAHNDSAAAALCQFIEQHRAHYDRVIGIIAMLKNKQHTRVAKQLGGHFDVLYCADTTGERAFSALQLQSIFAPLTTTPIIVESDIAIALNKARQQASKNDLIVAFGSFYVAKTLTEPADITA